MKNSKGLTLIEVIVSMAIISIMAVTVLGIFNTSITNIFKSGDRTEEVLNVKKEIDYLINANENQMDGTKEVTVQIGKLKSQTIYGDFISKESEDFNMEMRTFIPNKKQ